MHAICDDLITRPEPYFASSSAALENDVVRASVSQIDAP
jgi:hypothetical protein